LQSSSYFILQHNIKQIRIITVEYKNKEQIKIDIYARRLLEKQTLIELATYLVI